MNNAKHTPGPWFYNYDDRCITNQDGVTVINVHGAMSGDNTNADIAMLAAAPAMYEALTDAERMWNIARMIDSKHHAGNPISNDLWSDFHQYLMEWHTKRKNAIAQAEGNE